MNRRELFAAGLPLAMVTGGVANAADAPAGAAPAAAGKSPLFPEDPQFWFETVRMFGADEYGGALFGEVLATSARIKAGDYDSWYDAWNAIADRVAAEADSQLAKKRDVSARDSYLRASNYYRSSEFFLHADPKDPRVARAYRRSVTATRRRPSCSIRRSSRWRSPTSTPPCLGTGTGSTPPAGRGPR
jgi:hypothetical protein